MIDTAPGYRFCRAEEIVGQALKAGGRRDRVLIAIRCGLSWHGDQVFRNAAPARIRQEVEESLRRLRTDRIGQEVPLSAFVKYTTNWSGRWA